MLGRIREADPRAAEPTDRQRGSVIFLYPIGFMILLLFAAVAVDLSNSWLQQRELADLADGAANDALTYGLDRDILRDGGGYVVRADLAGEAALASLNAANDNNWTIISIGPPALNGAGNWEYTVVLESQVDYIFGPIGGVAGDTVRATGTAEVITQ